MNSAKAQRINYAILAGLLVAMFWTYSGVIYNKWFESDSYYSHGPLIPLVSLFLIWRIRESLARLPAESSRLGMAVLLFGVFVRIFGAYTRVNFVSGFSLVIIILGLVLYLFGKEISWKTLFPLLFLAWMVPLPQSTIIDISVELKTFASEVATRMLPRLGITVIKEGSALLFYNPNTASNEHRLIIGDVCSGLRSMIALLAFGSVFAYIARCSLRRRLEIFAASIPCSIVANMTRIIVITAIAYFWGSTFATVKKVIPIPLVGNYTIHDATGILIFVVAFVGFFTYEKLLNHSPFRLPKAAGPKKWIYEYYNKIIILADNQLGCLIKAGHIAADDAIRAKNSPQWQKAASLDSFTASPRNNKLKIKGTDRELSFEECVEMVKSGELRKDDFLSYANGSAGMRAGNLDFLRPHWPPPPAQALLKVLLYA
ncbi:MAG: exosortase/archaeosortase family protein, partial [Planctomycetes bacterium]|nr:exosortase/archaeosortase family protein [Planctomycetota bacterium]